MNHLPAALSTRQLTELLYSMGHTFDNLSSTRLATEEFLRTGNPEVLGSKQDLNLLEDLQEASSFALHYDYTSKPFDLSYLCAINAHLKRTAAIDPGVLRTSENIGVHTREGFYIPPVPHPSTLSEYFTTSLSSAYANSFLAASTLFAQLAKAQPFGDGNKRSALLAANGLLMRTRNSDGNNDNGHSRSDTVILAVPTTDPEMSTFNDQLAAWYLHDDSTVFGWLAQWNERQQRTGGVEP
jgi:hypothetical protein